MIDDYFQELQAVISASPAVHSSNVTFDKRSAHIGFVRGDLAFPDGSRLHFREFVNTENVVERYIYTCHYQRADGSLIFRYDNTPHFPDLPNFPITSMRARKRTLCQPTRPISLPS